MPEFAAVVFIDHAENHFAVTLHRLGAGFAVGPGNPVTLILRQQLLRGRIAGYTVWLLSECVRLLKH